MKTYALRADAREHTRLDASSADALFDELIKDSPPSPLDDDDAVLPDSQESLANSFGVSVRTRASERAKKAGQEAQVPAPKPQEEAPSKVRTYGRQRERKAKSAPHATEVEPVASSSSSASRSTSAGARARASKPSSAPAPVAASQDAPVAPAVPALSKASSAPKRVRAWDGSEPAATRHSVGTNREFGSACADVDDLLYQLDGCGPSQRLDVRRSALRAVLEQVASPETRLLLRAHGLTAKVLGSLRETQSDPELQLIALALRFLLAVDKCDIDAFDSEAIASLVEALPATGDAHAPEQPPPHAESVARALAACSCGGDGPPPATPGGIALRTLALIAQRSPAGREEIVRGGGLAAAFALVEAAAAGLAAPRHGPAGRKGRARSESPARRGSAPCAATLRRAREALLLAEHATAGGAAGGGAPEQPPAPVSAVLSILRACPAEEAACRHACLRLLMNVTNGHQLASAAFVAGGGLEPVLREALAGASGEDAFDGRICALGLLANVLEREPPARPALTALRLAGHEWGAPEALARRFSELESAGAVEAGVEAAYCGLALSFLLRDGPAACERALPLLPGGSTASLRRTLRGFGELHEGQRCLTPEARRCLRETLVALAALDASRAAGLDE